MAPQNISCNHPCSALTFVLLCRGTQTYPIEWILKCILSMFKTLISWWIDVTYNCVRRMILDKKYSIHKQDLYRVCPSNKNLNTCCIRVQRLSQHTVGKVQGNAWTGCKSIVGRAQIQSWTVSDLTCMSLYCGTLLANILTLGTKKRSALNLYNQSSRKWKRRDSMSSPFERGNSVHRV